MDILDLINPKSCDECTVSDKCSARYHNEYIKKKAIANMLGNKITRSVLGENSRPFQDGCYIKDQLDIMQYDHMKELGII